MKYLKLFVAALVLFAISTNITSCKKFLERPVEGQMDEDSAFASETSLLSFVNGINTLTGDAEFKGGRLVVLNELLGDQWKNNNFQGDYAEIYNRDNSYFGDTRNNFYAKAYAIVARANIALAHLDVAVTQRAFVEGQAKFFRGMANFELVRMMAQPWGYNVENSQLGIPLRTTVSLDSKDRSPVADVYAQVIADFKSADSLLPATSADGKYYTATKLAAKAYLAKVYFQMNNFAQAYAYSDSVIASNKFQLDTDFTSRFSIGLSKEGIWVIPTQTNYTVGDELRTNFSSRTGIPGFIFTDQFFNYATAKAADKRKIWYSNTLWAGANVLTKYNNQYFDMPILHLTEMKLIHAESGAEVGGAALAKGITDINDIMTRAYGGTTFNLPATATAAAIISTTRNERELELIGEGNRTQEIKRIGARSGQNIDRRGSPWNCDGFILQFPKKEVDANANFKLNPEGNCF